MKTKLLITLFFCVSFYTYSQVPNGDFSTGTTNWNVTGNNIALGSYASDYLFINNSTTVNETFVLQSSSFSLVPSQNYNLDIIYGHYDNTFSGNQLSQLSNIVLKDAVTNNVIHTLSLTLQPWPLPASPASEVDAYKSNAFVVPASGSYYFEFTGAVGRSFLFTQSEIYAFKDVAVNLVAPHSISGKLSYDLNADNCVTSLHQISNVLIKSVATNSGNVYFTNTDINGDYYQEFQESGNVITSIETPTLSASTITNSFGTPTQNLVNQDFCATTTMTTSPDLNVTIVPTTLARPGFISSYRVYYTNNGLPSVVSGSLTLSFDNTKLSYLSSLPVDDGFSGNTITWNYSNLNFFETRYIDIDFTINPPPTVSSGDILTFNTVIDPTTGDANALDNTFSLNQEVVNAYDPNDVLCLEGETINPSQIGDDLTYRIRFQNTGTAAAVNIAVETVLDSDLDWTTFQPLAASHAYTTSLVNGNQLTFDFNNIYLDDSTTNEPGSHGWIFYKIKPKNTTVIGDSFAATANIFFDFNPAVVTNTYITSVVAPLTYVPDDNFEQRLIDLGHDSGVLDDYVPTANISSLTNLYVSYSNISDLTGIEDFTALEGLTCGGNNLTSINVTQNLALKSLLCDNNQLSSLDISQNLQLEFLRINNNMLTNIDISNHGLINRLDVSNNSLVSLNVKNGNNTNFVQYASLANPNLVCIEVDDAAWSTANWAFKDAASTYVNNQAECATLSVDDSLPIDFKVFPNPVKNKLTVLTETEANYSIITIKGKVIIQGSFQTGENIVNTSILSNGLYFIQVETVDGVSTKKIMKQ